MFLIFIFLLISNVKLNSGKLSELNELEDLPLKSMQSLLENIMSQSLTPYKCVAIITDNSFNSIFNRKWIESFESFISFIFISVSDSEDLLSPNNSTQKTLKESCEAGCQMYIILLSNGLQCSRFLRFGDRYRMLDTRVKFILLYNNRLFEKNLYYLWKRIINVVFVRKYEGGQQKKPWFELLTVPFPSPISNILVPRRLDIYSRGKFQRNVDLFRDKTKDLQNQTMRVVTFSHIPGIHKVVDQSNLTDDENYTNISKSNHNNYKEFSGTEVEILKTVAQAMNFNFKIYEPENADIELWGRKDVGAKYTGLIGEMVYVHAEIALGDLHYIPTILNLMDLSIPYNTQCLTFLTPEALTDNSWKTLILPFSGFMWLGVLLCLFSSALIFYILATFHEKLNSSIENQSKVKQEDTLHVKKKKIITLTMFPEALKLDDGLKYNMMKEQYAKPTVEGQPTGLYQFTEPSNCLLYTYSMLLLVSLPKLPTGWSLRVLTGWYWLYSLLVVVAYRSSLTAILAQPVARVTIDTLQELIDSKLASGSWGEINSEFFKTSLDPTIRTIGENFETVKNSEDAVDRVANGKFAFYENTYFLKQATVKRQIRYADRMLANKNTTEFNNNIIREDRGLHIMRDCVINMPISIGLQKNSPIKPRFDKHIRRILEGGLIKKWLDDTMQKILNTEVQLETEIKAVMSMKKFLGALVVLFIGYIMSVIILIFEISYFNLVLKKHPNYNKYSRSIVIKVDKKN